jgi:hypothetical protein
MQVMCIRDMYISHNIYVNNMHTQTHTHAHICMYIDMHLYIVNTATSTTSGIISNSSPISNTRTPRSTLELRRESQALSLMATRLGCLPSRLSPSAWLTTSQMALSHNPAYPCVSLGSPPEISRRASWVVPETDVGSTKQMCSYWVYIPNTNFS